MNNGILTVADVLPDIQRVLGGIDSTTALERLNDAVEILSTESDWSPLRAYMDVLVGPDHTITCPRDVGTILAVDINGHPTQAHDFWFRFHLNGPGDSKHGLVGFHWMDDAPVATFLDPDCQNGNYLAATLETPADNNVSFRVFGTDASGNWIRTPDAVTGLLTDGFLVPTIYGTPAKNAYAPPIAKIVRIQIGAHVGQIVLNTLVGSTLTAIGKYFSNDTIPQYRRAKLGIHAQPVALPGGLSSCPCVRVAFKKAFDTLVESTDIIPLHSKYSLVLMVKALDKLEKDRIEEAEKYQALAVNYLNKKQESIDPPGGPSIQMADNNLIADKRDRIDG